MDLEALNAEMVEEVFMHHGAHSVSLTDAGDVPVLEPPPGETPLWRDTRITGLFAPDADLQSLHDDLLRTLDIDALPRHRIETLADRAWEREWLKDFGPMRFGSRLWVCPGIAEVDDDDAANDAVVVRLDPGLAFGTGTHPTTALCLEWLDSLSLQNQTLLDYGCGSGILVIAALKLGCREACATDIDPQALTATRQNAARNDVLTRLTLTDSDADIDAQFEIVVANILAGPLIEHAARIAARVKPGGLLALSGILSGQADEVLNAYAPWFEFDEPVFRNQGNQTWTRLAGKKGRN